MTIRTIVTGSGWRLGPALLSVLMALGPLFVAAPASAQRWTPLTGLLPEGDGTGNAGKNNATKGSESPPRESGRGMAAVSSVTTAERVLTVTLRETTADGQPHGDLGVRGMTVDEDLASGLGLSAAQGVMVTDASGELLAGDVIRSFNGRAVAHAEALAAALRATRAGEAVKVEIWRAGTGPGSLKDLLEDRANGGNVGAAASLGRLLSLGLVLGPRNNGEAARYYLMAAKEGHVASMTRYALFAKDGIGLAKNEALAAEWFRKAADGGQAAAMTNLGGLYEQGRGVKQDFSEAARWYRRAVEKDHVFAMHKLALLYEAGRGVAKNDNEAVRLLRRASDGGLSEATSWLADKYEQGRGIVKDESEAFRLNARAADQVRKAADHGNAVATFNLGILYRIGKGVAKSDTEAAYWVVKSLRLGDAYLVSELIRNPAVLSVADRKWLQQVLRDEGTYKGPINGQFTSEVRAAMEALANPA